MISISFISPFTAPSPLQEQVRTATPEQLTDLIVATLNSAKISSSTTPYEGWVTIHGNGVDWNLYCVVAKSHAGAPSIDVTAVSDDWCESRKLHEIVSKELLQISLVLNMALSVRVRSAPVPRWL